MSDEPLEKEALQVNLVEGESNGSDDARELPVVTPADSKNIDLADGDLAARGLSLDNEYPMQPQRKPHWLLDQRTWELLQGVKQTHHWKSYTLFRLVLVLLIEQAVLSSGMEPMVKLVVGLGAAFTSWCMPNFWLAFWKTEIGKRRASKRVPPFDCSWSKERLYREQLKR